MAIYVAIRSTRNTKAGRYYAGSPEEGLTPGQLKGGGRGHPVRFYPSSSVVITFESVADAIVEMGFTIPKRLLVPTLDHERQIEHMRQRGQLDKVEEIKDFQDDTRDIADEELERKHRAEDPTYKESWRKWGDDLPAERERKFRRDNPELFEDDGSGRVYDPRRHQGDSSSESDESDDEGGDS